MRARPPLSFSLAAAAAAAAALAACGDDGSDADADPDAAELGGATTTSDHGRTAFSQPAQNLDRAGRERFAAGDHFFNRGWVAAPATVEANDGLGPLFHATSCSGCHLRDGRAPPTDPDARLPEGPEAHIGLLFRISAPGPDGLLGPDARYGDQLAPRALPGVPPEARIAVVTERVTGAYGDGVPFELERPVYRFVELALGPFAEGTVVSPRLAPALPGLGLLEAVDEATVLAREDPDDRDGDGVRGHANRVQDARSRALVLGRFGWKANQPSLEQQTAAAFSGDLGITTDLFPRESCTPAETACLAKPTGGAPELSAEKVALVTDYQHLLGVPRRRDVGAPETARGERAFRAFGCAACHVPKLTTGTRTPYPALAGQTIRPFTDLLVHDLGDGLADGRPDGLADGRSWRTPPLWGLGLLPIVSGHERLLHDGRARGAAEAILWHGGEAERAREAFRTAPRADRDALLAFLRSL